mmetsp:Transcript_51539/g.59184  ORF Transcript_51539/g.59184 Transcript_51539/m.59184 type:complete len:115 (+) Transcript_51539:1-345(+)
MTLFPCDRVLSIAERVTIFPPSLRRKSRTIGTLKIIDAAWTTTCVTEFHPTACAHCDVSGRINAVPGKMPCGWYENRYLFCGFDKSTAALFPSSVWEDVTISFKLKYVSMSGIT